MSLVSMIIRMIKVFFLMLIFSINVSVKAEEPSGQDSKFLGKIQKGIVQEPKRCLIHPELICGLKTKSKSRAMFYNGSEFYLGENSILIRKGPGRWYLQKGSLWVKTDMPLAIETRFSELLSTEEGMSVLVQVDDEQLDSLIPLEKELVLRPKGGGDLFVLKIGMEVTIEGRDQRGVGYLRIPRSSHPRSVIKKWGSLYQGSPAVFSKSIGRYQSLWELEADQLAEQHKEIMAREIASHEASEKRRLERIRRYKAESKRLRGIFKKKNYY